MLFGRKGVMKTIKQIEEWVKKEIECCHNLSVQLPDQAASRYEAIILAFERLLYWIKDEKEE